MAVFGKLTLYGGKDPQQEQLERVLEINRLIGMMIWARWVLIAVLALYQFSVIGLEGFEESSWLVILSGPFLIPTVAFIFVSVYNLIFQFTYKKISHIKGVRYFQVFMDIAFSLIVIHFSGGPFSWAWVVFPMIVVESSILLDGTVDTWAVTVLSSALFGALLLLESQKIPSPIQMPYLSYLLEERATQDTFLWMRFNLVVVFFTIISAYFMSVFRRDQEKLQEKVVIDSLTGAYNVSHFYHLLNSEINRARRYDHQLTLLYVDLDGFKKINDLVGHFRGDELIKGVAETFKATLRRSDTEPAYDIDILCRYSGGSFMVILPDTPAEGAQAASQRMLKLIRVKSDSLLADWKKEMADNPDIGQLQLTVSIGAATFPDHCENVDDMVRKVEENLSKAKQAGKNQVVC